MYVCRYVDELREFGPAHFSFVSYLPRLLVIRLVLRLNLSNLGFAPVHMIDDYITNRFREI